MDFKDELGALKVVIDVEIEKQFDMAIKEARENDIFVADILKQTKKIALAGGKRIRGALLCQAYFGMGGKEKKKIIKIAAAIEIMHLFLLVHDDIIDKGIIRHGEITLHKRLSDKKSKNLIPDEAVHYGNSIAIIIGDMLYAIANKIIAKSGFDSNILVQVLSMVQDIVANTIIGQSQDIEIAYKNGIVTEKEVIAMCKNKTARYTMEGPLLLGAILAGHSDNNLRVSINNYAIPIGIAFQIQDDILGIFGDKKKTGKSVASDIEEGKMSIMVVNALKYANSEQKKQMNSILGKKGLTDNEVIIFQNIIQSSGALEYAKRLSKKHLEAGKKEIEKMLFNSKTKKFLLDLTEYLERRDV
jgi:geranylgeranyl diphosphate synthase type I